MHAIITKGLYFAMAKPSVCSEHCSGQWNCYFSTINFTKFIFFVCEQRRKVTGCAYGHFNLTFRDLHMELSNQKQ